MSTPWERIMKFQEQLKPAAATSGTTRDWPVRLNSTAQQFLPVNCVGSLPTRVKKVQNLVNESTKLIDQSRPPNPNSTLASFCQNCTCENCMNQSMLLGNDTQLNTSSIDALVQSYEKFLEMQKQQFHMMLQQFVGVMNTSVGAAAAVERCAGSVFTSSLDCNELAVTECDSSGTPKTTEDAENHRSELQTVAADTISPTSNLLGTVPEEDNSHVAIKEICNKKDEDPNRNLSRAIPKRVDKVPESSPSKDTACKIRKLQQRQELNNLSSFDSFDEYQDENFKPVRKSALFKLNDSVAFKSFDSSGSSPTKSKPACGVLSDKTISNKNKQLSDLALSLKKYPVDIGSKKKTERNKAVANPESHCTRSGRAVQKPRAYWATNSRPIEKEQSISESKKDSKRKRPMLETTITKNSNDDDHKVPKEIKTKTFSRRKASEEDESSATKETAMECAAGSEALKAMIAAHGIKDAVVVCDRTTATKTRTSKRTVVSSSSDAAVINNKLLPKTKNKGGRPKRVQGVSIAKDEIASTSSTVPSKRRKIDVPNLHPSEARSEGPNLHSKVSSLNLKGKSISKRVPQNKNNSFRHKGIPQNHMSESLERVQGSSNDLVESCSKELNLPKNMSMEKHMRKVRKLKQSSQSENVIDKPVQSQKSSAVSKQYNRKPAARRDSQSEVDLSSLETTEPEFVCYFEDEASTFCESSQN